MSNDASEKAWNRATAVLVAAVLIVFAVLIIREAAGQTTTTPNVKARLHGIAAAASPTPRVLWNGVHRCDYYASPNGRRTWPGTRARPFDLLTGQKRRLPQGKWLCLVDLME